MIKDFESKLEEYAHLLVDIGMNVQPGQTPRITASVDCAGLARKCVRICYERGAKDVIMDWTDGFVTRQRYLHADSSVFSEFPGYLAEKFSFMAQEKCPVLSIAGDDPALLSGVDPLRIRAQQKAASLPRKAFNELLMSNRIQWAVGAHPVLPWAHAVFPGLDPESALDMLWDAVFTACRITGDGKAVERWEAHLSSLSEKASVLNSLDLKELRYTNSLGTDLVIGLPEGHVWVGGSDDTDGGITFLPNIPTEEIFTAPHRLKVDGIVYSAMPLSLEGNIIDNFSVRFERGKIVEVQAEKGEYLLKEAVALDDGASYLGEVALVPFDSPIRKSGIMFLNTLFDENASCHLAFGSSYPENLKGSGDMSKDELIEHGLNDSITHVDFMVGTQDLSIEGIRRDGTSVAIFRDGSFAF